MNPAWSISVCWLVDLPLIHSIASSSIPWLSQSGPPAISCMAWACSDLVWAAPPLMQSIASASLRRSRQDFDPLQLCNLAWAVSPRLCWNLPLLDSIAASSLPPLREFQEQGLANSSWSVSKCGYPDSPLLNAIAAASRPRLRDNFDVQEIANTSWSYALLR